MHQKLFVCLIQRGGKNKYIHGMACKKYIHKVKPETLIKTL